MTLEEYIWSIHNIFDNAIAPQNARVGHKAQQYIEPGYVYAPYIPLTITPLFTVPKKKLSWIDRLLCLIGEYKGDDDMFVRKSVLSNYASKTINKNLFTTVKIEGRKCESNVWK